MKYQDLIINRKSSKTWELQIFRDGAIEDINNWKIYFTIKEYVNDTDENAKLRKIITSHSDAISGKTLIELTSSETNITKGNYYYSIDYKDDEDNEGILYTGRILIEEPILKARS